MNTEGTTRRSAIQSTSRGVRERSRTRRGLALVETMISLIILSIGLGSIALTSVRCAQMQTSTEEYVNAHNACRNVIERLQNGSLVARFQEYKAAPTSTIGDQQVQVTFPAILASQSLGGAIPLTARFRDLDGDGQIDLNAASADPAGLLPVRILVTRIGFRFQMDTLLVGS